MKQLNDEEIIEEKVKADSEIEENVHIANVYASMNCQYSGVPSVGLSFYALK